VAVVMVGVVIITLMVMMMSMPVGAMPVRSARIVLRARGLIVFERL
jgi:hypothetical protein